MTATKADRERAAKFYFTDSGINDYVRSWIDTGIIANLKHTEYYTALAAEFAAVRAEGAAHTPELLALCGDFAMFTYFQKKAAGDELIERFRALKEKIG